MSPPDSVQRAFDEARFGAARTLNVRDGLPSGDDAVRRVELWLRERQVTMPGADVLIITGRGNGSVDGIPVVRAAVARLLPSMRRQNVIVESREHGPGSFVVRLASLRSLVEAPRRNRRRTPLPPRKDPEALQALDAATRDVLRRLAEAALSALGAPASTGFVADEMMRQFSRLAQGIPAGPDREPALRLAIEQALEEYE